MDAVLIVFQFLFTLMTIDIVEQLMDALHQVNVPQDLIGMDLIESLLHSGIDPCAMTEEAIQAEVKAESAKDAEIAYAEMTAGLHDGQKFLADCIDWPLAWKRIKSMEACSVHPTEKPNHWLVVRNF
jgi:hypothetical protein